MHDYRSALMATGIIGTKSSASSGNSDEGISSVSQISNGRDNSPFHLTINKLNGKNYLEWAQYVMLVHDGKGKLGHLIGNS